MKPGAPQLYDDVPQNLAADYHFGDTAKVNEAFARAAHVTRLEITNNRVVVSTMEPRGAIGEYDPSIGKWTLHTGCQGVFGLRNQLARDVHARSQ